MGIRTGSEFRESLRDGRTIYVDGERISDVTAYPPFHGTIDTLASLYDLQHEHRDLLTYASPKTGDAVSLSFLMGDTVEQVDRRRRAEEFRCELTCGLMGRMPDFMNALVTDAAIMNLPRNPRFEANLTRYYEDCRENDWCLTHTLVDPQVDRSKGPGEQADPSGRESYDRGRGTFDRPLSSRFDEEDALAIFENVLVPWERVFIAGDVEASNAFLAKAPGYALLQATIRGMVKLKFMCGLACYLAETVGRSEALHVQAQLGELIAQAEMLRGAAQAGVVEVAAARKEGQPIRTVASALWVFVPQAHMRAAEVIRQVSGSGLIMTPTEKDFANPEIAAHLERYLQGKGVSAKRRVQLFKLAWDIIGEQFGSRQLQYEWFYAGDLYFTRSRFYRSPAVGEMKSLVDRILER